MAITAFDTTSNSLSYVSKRSFPLCRKLSTAQTTSKERYQSKFKSYNEMIESEESSARQSILIEDKCARLKHVQQKAMSLIELDDYRHFLSRNCVLHSNPTLPITSRMLQISAIPSNLKSVDTSGYSPTIHLAGRKPSKSSSVSLVDRIEAPDCVSEFGSRLRFFFLQHLEELLCSGTFSSFRLRPFGSSVNALGNDESDLDIVMSPISSIEYDPNLVLVHHTRPSLSEKLRIRCLANLVGEQIQMFVPGILKSQKILGARVPIVKLASDLTGLECDISFFNPNAVAMARGVFQMAKIEPRLVDLYSFLKKWSALNGLTTQTFVGFTNFMFLSLLIAFMQTRKPQLLPAMASIEEQATFTANDTLSPADDLLIEFFEFLLTFDFSRKGFSVLGGHTVSKTSNDVMYIENAFDVSHNVCKNIKKKELDKLLVCLKNSMRTLHQNKVTASNGIK